MLLTINAVISPLKCLGRQWLWLPVDIVMGNIAVRRTWRLPRHSQLVWKLCYSRYISRWRWLCNSETQTFKENIQPTTSSCSHNVLCCYTDWFTTHSKQNRSLQTSFLADLANHLANHLLKKLKTNTKKLTCIIKSRDITTQTKKTLGLVVLHSWFLQPKAHIWAVNTQQRVHTHIRLTALCLGLPGWAGTRKVKPIWILLKQETVSGSGIRWAICKSEPCSRQITMPAPHRSVFLQAGRPSCRPTTVSKHWRQ